MRTLACALIALAALAPAGCVEHHYHPRRPLLPRPILYPVEVPVRPVIVPAPCPWRPRRPC